MHNMINTEVYQSFDAFQTSSNGCTCQFFFFFFFFYIMELYTRQNFKRGSLDWFYNLNSDIIAVPQILSYKFWEFIVVTSRNSNKSLKNDSKIAQGLTYCIRHYFRVQLFSRFWPGAVIREGLISRFCWCCHYYK